MENLEYLANYYNRYDEDNRLLSRHGSVEFCTTVRYIEKYLRPGMKILEIGAGTGRYSHYFANKGYEVDAVELIEHNIDIFRSKITPDEKISVTQGNALDLSFIESGKYDIVLLLGPMYHLYCDEDKVKALSEALRTAKPGGLLYSAYCMNEATIICYCFGRKMINDEVTQSHIDPLTFKCASIPSEVFELYRREEIDALNARLDARRLHFVGTDMYTNYFSEMIDSMSDEMFDTYLRYHFFICERDDMTGFSHHTLDVLQKN